MQGKSMHQIREERRAAELRAACDKNPEAFIAQTEWLIRLMKASMVGLIVIAIGLSMLIVAFLIGIFLRPGFVIAIWLAFPTYFLWRGVLSSLRAEYAPWNPIALTPQTMPELLQYVYEVCQKMGVPVPRIVGLSSLHEIKLKTNRMYVLHGKFDDLLSVGFPSLATMSPEFVRGAIAFELCYCGNGFAARNRRARLEASSFGMVMAQAEFAEIGNFLYINRIFESLHETLQARVVAASAHESREAADLWRRVVDDRSLGVALVAAAVLPKVRGKLAFDLIRSHEVTSSAPFPSHYRRMETAASTDVSELSLDPIKLQLLQMHRLVWLAEPNCSIDLQYVIPAELDDEDSIRELAKRVGRPLDQSAYDSWATNDLRFELARLEASVHEHEKNALEEIAEDAAFANEQIMNYSHGIVVEPFAQVQAARMARGFWGTPGSDDILQLVKFFHARYPNEPRISLWLGTLQAQFNSTDPNSVALLAENCRHVPHPWSLWAAEDLLAARLLSGQTENIRAGAVALHQEEKSTIGAENEIRKNWARGRFEPLELPPESLNLLKGALTYEQNFRAAYGMTFRSVDYPGQVLHYICLEPDKLPLVGSSYPDEVHRSVAELWFALPPRAYLSPIVSRWGVNRKIRKKATKIWVRSTK
jgi:hypothetical protein